MYMLVISDGRRASRIIPPILDAESFGWAVVVDGYHCC
jgi:hypothetical protein